MSDWIEEAQKKVADGLVTLANQGSVPAATAVLKLLAEERAKATAERLSGRLGELKGDSAGISGFLGEAGMHPQEVETILGHEMTENDRKAYTAGKLARKAEVRHIELQRVRDGNGKIDDWMR